MATKFEEMLKEALKAKGLSEIAAPPAVSATATATANPAPTASATAAVIPTAAPAADIPGFEIAPEETGVPGFEVAPDQTFDTSTVVTPELVAGMDYNTLYNLTLPDSPLAPEQRGALANALRGSSDLADLFSGFDTQYGSDIAPAEAPKNRGDIAKNYNSQVSTAVAANVAIMEAVKGVKQRYLDENPAQASGVGGQLAQSFLEGTAAPRPEGVTGTPVPSVSRAAGMVASNSAAFGFGDEIMAALGNDTTATADIAKQTLGETNPGLALVAELGGAVASPSIGLAALSKAKMGLKATDTWLKTLGKVTAASAVDSAIASVGNGGDIALDTGVGAAIGGGLTIGSKALGVASVATKGLVKLLNSNKSDVDVANSVIKEMSEMTRIPADKLKTEILKGDNIMNVLTANGLSIDDAAKAISKITQKSTTNTTASEIRDFASDQVSSINAKNSKEVVDYLESIDPRDAGKEIEMLYNSSSSSDLAEITAKLMNTNGAPMYSEELRNAISQRAAADQNILAGSGRTKIDARDILIDKETGRIYVSNADAKRLTDEELTEDSLFGYAREDLHELTAGDEIRGDIFQSADSKLAGKMTFKPGEAPDQSFAVVVNRVRKDANQILEGSIEGLGKANKAYSAKKAAKDAMELTASFVKKTEFQPKDIDAYVEAIKATSSVTDKERKAAVLSGLKNFFGSNTKMSEILTDSGKFNPEFSRAMQDVGIPKNELDAFELMARDKAFFSAFLKSTGVGAADDSMLTMGVKKFLVHLFFNTPVNATKNALLSTFGNKLTKNMGNVATSENYNTFIKQIATLKESDFKQIQALMADKGLGVFAATSKYLMPKIATGAARYTASQ